MSQCVKRFFLEKIVELGYTCSIGCHHVSSATQHLILLSSPQATMAVDPPNECPRIATWHISIWLCIILTFNLALPLTALDSCVSRPPSSISNTSTTLRISPTLCNPQNVCDSSENDSEQRHTSPSIKYFHWNEMEVILRHILSDAELQFLT